MGGCATAAQQFINGGLPAVEYVTVTWQPVAGQFVMRDVPINFSKPYKFICITGLHDGFSGASMYLHFNPLNLDKGAANTNPNGSEQWIPFAVLTANTNRGIGRWIKLRQPVKTLYFDSNDAAFVFIITFAGTNDIANTNLIRS